MWTSLVGVWLNSVNCYDFQLCVCDVVIFSSVLMFLLFHHLNRFNPIDEAKGRWLLSVYLYLYKLVLFYCYLGIFLLWIPVSWLVLDPWALGNLLACSLLILERFMALCHWNTLPFKNLYSSSFSTWYL